MEQIKIGNKYRIMTDAGTKLWNRISFWTSSADIEMPDGNSCETNVGAIKGITTNTDVNEEGYAVDATIVKDINDSLIADNDVKFNFAYDSTFGNYGYNITDESTGKTTYTPFNSGGNVKINYHTHISSCYGTITCTGTLVYATEGTMSFPCANGYSDHSGQYYVYYCNKCGRKYVDEPYCSQNGGDSYPTKKATAGTCGATTTGIVCGKSTTTASDADSIEYQGVLYYPTT